ncbi:hypothetical protein [Janibacter sp. LM]|uniref:hypothetical protein n=1 Tax=Janibacter sp. LM TaxID=3144845 RepID=UPI0031F68654
MTAPTTGARLHAALIDALAPVTRWRHPFPGDGQPVRVNDTGLDVWENHVGDARIDPDGPGGTPGTAHAYLFLQTGPGGNAHTRATRAASLTVWRPILTFAGGTPRKVQWGLDRARPLLDGLVLTDATGRPITSPFHEGLLPSEQYDPGPLQVDTDPSPPRWFVPIQLACQAR